MTDLRRLALGVVPLAAGAVVPVSLVEDGGAWCPLRAATGIPCPWCGATRAFVYAGHLDGRWVEYGAVWVVAAVTIVVLAVVGGRVSRVRALPALAVVTAVAWAWALAHAGTIAPSG